MLFNRLYYQLKPYLPRPLRISVRRWAAQRLLPKVGDIWPIKEGTQTPPPGWPGWPDGKKFAVVLTHDVESPQGLAKVKPLMELEKSLGFRSSFGFIPEGTYTVPADLRHLISDLGFEVSVHDLHHDGKLYRSREAFRKNAEKINHYLKEWNAVGFRSGLMHHNLDWLHDLNIAYDASTFDTDPFEPQPDGADTIFPFWVPRPEARDQKSEVSGQRSEVRSQRTEIRDQRSEICPPPSGLSSPSDLTSDFRPLTSGLIPTSDLRPLTSGLACSLLPAVDGSPLPAPCSLLAIPHTGYVELPYTLPQDSTLFTLFREESIDIWTRKLDWIAANGGMALVNVHPDYLEDRMFQANSNQTVQDQYKAFLQHIRHRFSGQYWQPLPRELAEYVKPLRPAKAPSPKRIGMVTYSFFESDNRVIRYAESLAERGDHVEVLALKKNVGQPDKEIIKGVHLNRIQQRFEKNERRKSDYLLRILRFAFTASWTLARNHMRQPYDLLHIHNIPDFLVFAAWLPKLTGTKVILDIHDIVPEFFASKFNALPDARMVRWLKKVERVSAAFADHVIISNHLWLEKYITRSAPPSKCSVFINNVDSDIFCPREKIHHNGKSVIIFPGGLYWHQGLDIAIRAFATVTRQLPHAEFQIYGDGSTKENLVALTKELGLENKVLFSSPLPIRQVAEVMANADLGVVPKRADGFGNEAYSTKIMEFMSLGVPVVASSTKIDRYYFDDTVLRFFESGNSEAMATAMLDVLKNKELRTQLTTNASAYAAKNNWETQKPRYLQLVDNLASPKGATPSQPRATP